MKSNEEMIKELKAAGCTIEMIPVVSFYAYRSLKYELLSIDKAYHKLIQRKVCSLLESAEEDA